MGRLPRDRCFLAVDISCIQCRYRFPGLPWLSLRIPRRLSKHLRMTAYPIPWSEIPEASLIGVALAVVAAYADKYNSINWLGRRIKASNRLNDKDIWETFFHHPKIGWVYVTDHKADRLYFDGYSTIQIRKKPES